MNRVDPLIALELPAEPHSAKVARDAVAGLDGHLGDVFGDVVLVISELVTNSVRHAGLDAGEPVQLSVNVEGETVRVAVRDPGPGFKPPARADGSGARRRLGPRAGRAARGALGRRARRRGQRRVVRAEAAMSFEARTERVGAATVVIFIGELDIASEAPAAAALEDALGDGGVLVADLRELDLHRLDRRARAAHRPPARDEEGDALRRGRGPTGWCASCSRSRASTSASRSSTTRRS